MTWFQYFFTTHLFTNNKNHFIVNYLSKYHVKKGVTLAVLKAFIQTRGGVPLYVPVLVPVLYVYLAAYIHLSIVFGFGLHEHARPLQWYRVMLTYTIYMYT